jgi:hypothetical protein
MDDYYNQDDSEVFCEFCLCYPQSVSYLCQQEEQEEDNAIEYSIVYYEEINWDVSWWEMWYTTRYAVTRDVWDTTVCEGIGEDTRHFTEVRYDVKKELVRLLVRLLVTSPIRDVM